MEPTKPRLPYVQDQLTYSFEEAAGQLRMRTVSPIRWLIYDKKLRSVFVGREQVIYHADLVKFLAESE